MSAKTDAILNDLRNQTPENILAIGQQALNIVNNYMFKVLKPELRPETVVVTIIDTMIGVDGKLTSAEVSFLNALLGTDIDFDGMLGLANKYNTEANRQYIEDLVDASPSEIRNAIVLLCGSIFACDGRLEDAEYSYFERLLF